MLIVEIHTERFRCRSGPDYFTFIIDFEYLGGLLASTAFLSCPCQLQTYRPPSFCRKQAGHEEQADTFDIVLTVTTGYFAVIKVHLHQGVTVTTGNPNGCRSPTPMS